MATTFDTLAAARDFEKASMDRRQAEAVAGQGDLATRGDVDALRTTTEADLKAVRSDISGLRRLVGVNIAVSLATLAAVPAMAFQ